MVSRNEDQSDQINWRAITIGIVTTLFVSVLSGVAVYYITREKPPKIPQEKLIYTIEHSATFGGGPDGITFLTLNVENAGDKSARNVRIIAPFHQPWKLRDHRVSISTGAAAAYQDGSDAGKLSVVLTTMVPTEKLKISALLNGPPLVQPQFSIQSDDSVATVAPSLSALPTVTDDSLKTVGIIIVVIAGLVVQGAIFLFPFVRRWGNRKSRYTTSLNNTAFIFLLQGLVAEGEVLIAKEIYEEGAAAISLANHGLALSLLGNDELSNKRFEAANWLAITDNDRAVIAFDRAISALHKRDFEAGRNFLGEAFSYGRKDISEYCDLCVYIRAASREDAAVQEMVKNGGKNGA